MIIKYKFVTGEVVELQVPNHIAEATIDKLLPIERVIIERYYILNQTLGEIACDCDKSYPQLARKMLRLSLQIVVHLL